MRSPPALTVARQPGSTTVVEVRSKMIAGPATLRAGAERLAVEDGRVVVAPAMNA